MGLKTATPFIALAVGLLFRLFLPDDATEADKLLAYCGGFIGIYVISIFAVLPDKQ